ncbi:MAG: DUF411 domain-containing protein [Pseudomonadota bacterium]
MCRVLLAAAMVTGLCGGAAAAGSPPAPLTVYKDANCGCCAKWIEHLDAHGIAARAVDLDTGALAARKRELGIPPRMQSCHTGVTAAGLVFEGHVPATSMARFLADHPPGARGLAVPGMPPGSPGMEMGDRFAPYTVWQLDADGGAAAFEEIEDRGAQYAPGRRP